MWDLHTNNNPPPCVLTLSSPGIVTPNKLRFDADQTSPPPPSSSSSPGFRDLSRSEPALISQWHSASCKRLILRGCPNLSPFISTWWAETPLKLFQTSDNSHIYLLTSFRSWGEPLQLPRVMQT